MQDATAAEQPDDLRVARVADEFRLRVALPDPEIDAGIGTRLRDPVRDGVAVEVDQRDDHVFGRGHCAT
jgi:hypothetical protein